MAPFDGGKYKSFASSLETPHSGYHFHPQRKGRFMEGWYFKVAIPAKVSAVLSICFILLSHISYLD